MSATKYKSMFRTKTPVYGHSFGYITGRPDDINWNELSSKLYKFADAELHRTSFENPRTNYTGGSDLRVVWFTGDGFLTRPLQYPVCTEFRFFIQATPRGIYTPRIYTIVVQEIEFSCRSTWIKGDVKQWMVNVFKEIYDPKIIEKRLLDERRIKDELADFFDRN